ncbi:Exonuclease RNase T/DNA polymerase III [Penicillium lagena]|uniref:Exonuclease RNase T/DNA polymerase III n=1 Tax=Penicillium lagena TaxID=94218 RepID=UPI002540AACB|nr:Exonuclease RNase T/DNA polymerase III [Penicillium lagena]KAJ5612046.1 Exonuclease RNase T/DNA polymerase III [Penicillium lagena]
MLQYHADAMQILLNDQTVLFGHSFSHDFDVLKVFHPKVVDSAILNSEAVFLTFLPTETLARLWSLKTLVKDLLGYDIQTGDGRYSALEDAYAARDVVIWCIRNPE